MFDTFSTWLTLGAAVARARGRSRLAGGMLLVVAVGYAGVLHERLAGARLTGYRHPRLGKLSPNQVALHAAAGALGFRWVTKS